MDLFFLKVGAKCKQLSEPVADSGFPLGGGWRGRTPRGGTPWIHQCEMPNYSASLFREIGTTHCVKELPNCAFHSGGSRISRRGRQPRRGAPTPEAATFGKICMSKRKNLGP